MRKLTKEDLKVNPDIENVYETTLIIDEHNIEISIDPNDVELEKTIELVNKIVDNFEVYERKARKLVIDEYLDNYNENWRDEENGEQQLDEKAFSDNLTLTSISFLSDSSVDFFYSENGMFGNHVLIAQSCDGENFDDTTMYR